METRKDRNDANFHFGKDEEDVLPGTKLCKGTQFVRGQEDSRW